MPSIRISFPEKKHIHAEIHLTGSKSECNRALLIRALSKGLVSVENQSAAADTLTLKRALDSLRAGHETTARLSIDVGPAGTAMRFLSAFLCLQDGQFLLTGSERMKQRPIGILVDALRQLGANIQYIDKEGFPPLQIDGPFEQKQAEITIDGQVSSQYLSALLLIAPVLPQGLTLHISGDLTSKPYVEMTLSMLEQAGIRHQWDESCISIENQAFRPGSLYVEPDWSAASYWYAVAALADEAQLFLPGLNLYSLQGDSRITEIMANFGISSQFKDGGVYLKKEPKPLLRKIFDLKDCPDLAQTLIVVCAALGHNCTFTGLETLKIKETDRINALQTELAKIGVQLIEKNHSYKLDCSKLHFPDQLRIQTYEDHRMAMAFAPLALKIKEIEIEEKDVVNKSYPYFWDDLKKAGFSAAEITI